MCLSVSQCLPALSLALSPKLLVPTEDVNLQNIKIKKHRVSFLLKVHSFPTAASRCSFLLRQVENTASVGDTLGALQGTQQIF